MVEAIRDADPGEHESDWIEWKRELNLGTDAVHRFEVARHILGFGNRDPDAAASFCEGTAYLVVGVEPGAVQDLPSWDPANLDNWISKYVASGAPRWRADRLDVDGKQVVVFTIEAPSPGDRICTLQHGFDKTLAGRIYARRGGKTLEASPAEITHLEARLARGQADIEVTLEAEIDGDLSPLFLPDTAFERWRENERKSLLRSLPATPDRSSSFPIALPSITLDPRSQDEFVAEVDEYLLSAKQRWLSLAHKKAMEACLAVVQLTIVNSGSRNFPATQIELVLPRGVLAFVHESDPDAAFDPPRRPSRFGSPPNLTVDAIPALYRDSHEIDYRQKEGVVRFLPIDVRPGRRHELPELHLGIPAELTGQTLKASWRATSTGATSWAEGSFELPVADPPAVLGRAGGGDADIE
ncbi:MAG: helix-turn-helix domain-containing protein [Solirubrobacterales bacterium]